MKFYELETDQGVLLGLVMCRMKHQILAHLLIPAIGLAMALTVALLRWFGY